MKLCLYCCGAKIAAGTIYISVFIVIYFAEGLNWLPRVVWLGIISFTAKIWESSVNSCVFNQQGRAYYFLSVVSEQHTLDL